MTDKKLYNIYGKEQLKERLNDENFNRITCSFYNYHIIEDLESTRDSLYSDLDALDILGRVYIADEGINAQFNIPDYNWDAFLSLNNKYPFLKKIKIKKAIQEGVSFLKLKVMIKDEIVAWGISKNDYDMRQTGQHLNATEFNSLIENEDTLLIDMRNNYESEVGRFKNAVCPKSKRSKDLIKEVKDVIKNHGNKNIAIYCTGGIRCEKASSHLIKEGYKNIFQLEGGIIEYAHQIKKNNLKSKFIGKNFVFDDRLGERITDDIIADCHLCDSPSDKHINCNNDACHILFIICDECYTDLDGCCSSECQNIYHLPIEKQKEARKKFAKKFKNNFRPIPKRN